MPKKSHRLGRLLRAAGQSPVFTHGLATVCTSVSRPWMLCPCFGGALPLI